MKSSVPCRPFETQLRLDFPMNLGVRSPTDLLYVTFNQEYRWLRAAPCEGRADPGRTQLHRRRHARRVPDIQLRPVRPLLCQMSVAVLRFSARGADARADDGGIGIVEMLFTTSLVALVGGGDQPAFSPRKLVLINTKVRWVVYKRWGGYELTVSDRAIE